MRGEFVDVGGSRLYYYAAGTRGAGEPVLLLHGFPTSGHLWSDVVALMPGGHRIIVTDLLGYGRSDPPGRSSLSLAAHAARTLALLDALGVQQACVVGHGTGGGVAQWLAINAPHRVTRLALVNSVAFTQWPPRDVRIARALRGLLRHLPVNWLLPMVRADIERGYFEPYRAAHSIDKYQRAFSSEAGRYVFLEHLAALDATETSVLSPQLTAIHVPTAVIAGESDPFLSLTLGARLAAAIPGATYDIAPDARHFTPEDNPRVVADVLAELLKRER